MGIRPSELLDIDDPYSAYCFDEATIHFGTWVEDNVKAVEGKTESQRQGKAENVMRKCLGMEQKFADILKAKD